MSIPKNYTVPGKPPLFVSEADQDRCRASGAKKLPGVNRRLEFCDQCSWRGKGAGNLAMHRRSAHP